MKCKFNQRLVITACVILAIGWATTQRKGFKQIVQLDKKAEAEQVKQTPRDADFYHNRGSAYAKKGQYDEAIADYTRAIEINPKDDMAYVNRGFAYGSPDSVLRKTGRSRELIIL